MKYKLLSIVLFLFVYGGANAQFTNVMISSMSNPNEPSIMMNPKNHNQLVAGANLSSFYYSTNGGSNWTRGSLTSTYGVWGDPCIVVDTAGNFYYFHLSNATNWIDRIVCQSPLTVA